VQKETAPRDSCCRAFLNPTNISRCAELDGAVLRSEYQYQMHRLRKRFFVQRELTIGTEWPRPEKLCYWIHFCTHLNSRLGRLKVESLSGRGLRR